jgi:hypothetical protein
MSETITLHALDLSGETTLKLFLRKDDGTLLNTGGDTLAEISSSGVFTATLAESRSGLGTLAVRVCDGTETADNLLYDDFLPEGTTVIGAKVAAELDSGSITAVQSGLATSANQTTILNRLGAWTGSGINNILGAMRALAAKAAALTPSDISTGTTYDNVTDSLEAQADVGGGLTVEQAQQLTDIQDSIDAYVSGVTAAAVDSPGTIVGFPTSLNIGDSYIQDVNSSITINVVDENEDPVDTWGSYSVNTTGFAPELVITQSGRTGRVKATVTYDTDHFVVELPCSETKRASPGVATMSFVLKWITDGKIVAQRTITSAQAVTWNEMI